MCQTVLCATKSATKPRNTKTWACMYLQEDLSTPPSDEPLGDTNVRHTYRSQCNHEFTGLDVIAYLGKGSSNHSPGPMKVFKTQADDKSTSIYDPGGLRITHTQGTNHHARNTSALLIHICILLWTRPIRTT